MINVFLLENFQTIPMLATNSSRLCIFLPTVMCMYVVCII